MQYDYGIAKMHIRFTFVREGTRIRDNSKRNCDNYNASRRHQLQPKGLRRRPKHLQKRRVTESHAVEQNAAGNKAAGTRGLNA